MAKKKATPRKRAPRTAEAVKRAEVHKTLVQHATAIGKLRSEVLALRGAAPSVSPSVSIDKTLERRIEILEAEKAEALDWQARTQRGKQEARDCCDALTAELGQVSEDLRGRQSVIDNAGKAFMSLDPGIAFEGALDGAMAAAVGKIRRLRKHCGQLEIYLARKEREGTDGAAGHEYEQRLQEARDTIQKLQDRLHAQTQAGAIENETNEDAIEKVVEVLREVLDQYVRDAEDGSWPPDFLIQTAREITLFDEIEKQDEKQDEKARPETVGTCEPSEPSEQYRWTMQETTRPGDGTIPLRFADLLAEQLRWERQRVDRLITFLGAGRSSVGPLEDKPKPFGYDMQCPTLEEIAGSPGRKSKPERFGGDD